MRDPTTVVPSTEKAAIPEPELHVSFLATLMVMAIELYQAESERQFCHYVTYAHRKLVQFVESRKQMTAESYRFFSEHAYNQFFQHESFHISARCKAQAKDIGASGTFHTSNKLSGYVWLGSETKLVHVPEDQAGDVQTGADDEADERANDLPSLSVRVQQDDQDEVQEEVQEEPQNEEQQDDKVHEEVPDEPMEGVCSQEGEETQEQPGYSEEIERPEFPPARTPEERYGNFLMSQFSGKDLVKIRQWVFNLSNAIPASEREDHPTLPQTVEDANAFGMVWFVEAIATESHHDFMKTFPVMTDTDMDHDEFHEMKLIFKRIMDENEHIHISTFEEEGNPNIPKDPKNKKEIEYMTPENKQLVLETDNSGLIDCLVQWLNMLNNAQQGFATEDC